MEEELLETFLSELCRHLQKPKCFRLKNIDSVNRLLEAATVERVADHLVKPLVCQPFPNISSYKFLDLSS